MAFTADEALSLLRNAHANGRLAHAYLITGPEGSGTRDVAEGLAGILLGDADNPLAHPDVHIAEPESKSRRITIDQIRELERKLQMRSLRGGRKVVLIFAADRLLEGAANAFLKTLEEPPGGSHIILVSSLPEQLLETILSRCIEVPLKPGPRRGLTERQRQLAESLRHYASVERPDLGQTFGLVRDFQSLLATAKEAITAETEGALKAEEKRYKEASGVGADWIDDREDYFKALAEARYRNERGVLVDTLESWWADILRQQHGATHLDLPDLSAFTSDLGRRLPTSQVLRRAAAIGELRENFGRNVHEQLALEVAFLDAFGAAQ
jgi:DNA polymerase-3 subunit delta'